MRYLTHSFAHAETLDRARRWLIHAGVTPERIRVHHHGIPSLIISADPAEFDSLNMIIRAAEITDPDGLPGIWDLARLPHSHEHTPEPLISPASMSAVRPSFPLAWGVVDAAEDEELRSQIELQRTYCESRE